MDDKDEQEAPRLGVVTFPATIGAVSVPKEELTEQRQDELIKEKEIGAG